MTNAPMKARVIDSCPAPTLDRLSGSRRETASFCRRNTSSFCSLRTAGYLPANTRLSGRRAATSVDVINLLIDAGADVEARSNDGATPLESWAKFLRRRPAIELIKRGARFDSLDAERLRLNPYVARFIESLR